MLVNDAVKIIGKLQQRKFLLNEKVLNLHPENIVSSRKFQLYRLNSKKQQNINLQTSAKRYLTRRSNSQSTGQMLPVLHKHFAMIKQKSGNERMEQSSLSLKWPQYYRKDGKLSARDECYKAVVAELGKLSNIIS